MMENVQLWVYGTAAVIDTVLLFALLERHNWRAVTVWMLFLALGVWCWHGGTFVRHLVDQSVGPLADPVRWFSMVSMAFGLMLMPSAAVHGTCRLLAHGQFQIGPRPDFRMVLCYLPLVLLIPMSRTLALQPESQFLPSLARYHFPYVIWLGAASLWTAYGLAKTASSSRDNPTRWFNWLLATSMLLIALLTAVFVFVWPRFPTTAMILQPIVAVSPVIPVLLFAYFVVRFQLLPLILERTLAYGAVVVGAMLFHAVVLQEAVSVVAVRYRLNMGIVEGIVVLGIVLFYQPLRDRVAAALQSLVDSSRERRNERRRLAVQLAARAGDAAGDLLNWFTTTLQQSFGTGLAASWLHDRDGRIVSRAGMTELLSDGQVEQLLSAMVRAELQFMTRYSVGDTEILQLLDRIRAGAVLRFQHAEVSGLFLIGCSRWGQPPNDEDLHALSLLVEQFGITLHSSQLQMMQVAAEHRLLQQEKMSVLGLLAGSLAHEIKNPLSSIKTITRVLSEELGSGSPHADDLRMISGEIDRLTVSTAELLEAARPPRSDGPAVPLSRLLSPTLRLLHHLAREYRAALEVSFPEQPVILSIDQVSLREVIFNLISNGLEAAGEGGTVQLLCRCAAETLLIEVKDTGSGIGREQMAHVFEPFFTTKQSGTGLGLFVVARRVRELGGEISLHSAADPGSRFRTEFHLSLPLNSSTRD